MPQVSLVIPVYNSAQFLPECLESLFQQIYQNIEIICVDDGSEDDSLAILHEYAKKDKRLKVLSRHNDGNGAAGARNLGLKNATGKYVMFLDSDDFFELSMIKLLVDKAEQTGAELVICGADVFNNSTKMYIGNYSSIELENAPSKCVFSYKDCPEKIFQIGDSVTWNKLYLKMLLDINNLKFESIPITDDQYVSCLAMVLAQRIAVVKKSLIHYRVGTGTSQVDKIAMYPRSGYMPFVSVVNYMKQHNIYTLVKKSYINLCMRMMRRYFDLMTSYEYLRFLYNTYINEVFPMIEAENLSKPMEYFYDKRIREWYELVTNHPLSEILFLTSRAYGASMTTAILRFQVPYDKIIPRSRVVIVGKNIVGRYWYTQLLLSDYCEVVAWVNNEMEIQQSMTYDKILIAK